MSGECCKSSEIFYPTQGGSAVDAVEAAVRNMEDNPLFNAGRGCALTEENTAELDALIMDGHSLAAGETVDVEADAVFILGDALWPCGLCSVLVRFMFILSRDNCFLILVNFRDQGVIA